MGAEIAVAISWLYSTLNGDSTLHTSAPGGVWRAEAPPGTATPYVILIYQQNPSHDEIVFGGGRAFGDLFFEIVATGPAKVTQTIASAAGRLDTLLTVSQQTSISGGTLLACYRTQSSESDPLINGETWTNMGGIYRIMMKAS